MSVARTEWIAERIGILVHMGGCPEADAIPAAQRQWEAWCRDRNIDPATGMPLGATEKRQERTEG